MGEENQGGPSQPESELEEPPEGGGGVVIGPEVPEPPDLSETPFDGTTTGGAAPSNQININFDPSRSGCGCPCERIRFIQTVQIFVDGNPVDPGDLAGSAEYRDNTALDDDPDTPEDETGTHVDRLPGRREPYYGGNGAGIGTSTVGQCNGTSTAAWMVDEPFVPNAWFQPGGADRDHGNDWDADEIVFKFEACAFCEAGENAGAFAECVTWTYTRTAADVAAGSDGTAVIDGTTGKPSKSFKKAVERWAETNNFDLPGSS